METLKETLNQFKWVLLAGVIVAVLIALITANLHVLQFMKYKMQNDAEGVLSILQTQAKIEARQDDWFFVQGMNYLLNEDEYSEEVRIFFEEEFSSLSLDWQQEIIKSYNAKGLYLPMSKELMEVLMKHIDADSVKSYVNRLEPTDFEQGLLYIYGNNPKVDEALISELYKVLSIYSQQLPFDKFQFDLFELLNVTDEDQEVMKLILSKIDSSKAKENIFKVLRTQTISEEQLCNWMEFFNGTGIISASEYTKFNEIYGNICLIRNQYQALDAKQVELQNNKDAVDAQISESSKQLQEKQSQVSSLEDEISSLEASIENLTNYSYMALYIERASGTGSNEYIASIPRNGLFGVKPSSLKYIVKLESTSFVKEGIYNLNIYYEGTKKSASGDECSYYIEVSDGDIANIENMKTQRLEKIEALDALKAEVEQITNEINTIKEENNYEANETALKNIVLQRQEYTTRVNEEVVKLRQLFNLSNITISLRSGESK